VGLSLREGSLLIINKARVLYVSSRMQSFSNIVEFKVNSRSLLSQHRNLMMIFWSY